MDTFADWLITEKKEPGLVLQQGGIVPQNLQKAKKVDLIVLPKSVNGTNCFNCKFVQGSGETKFCNHPEVLQWVNKHNCCVKWDAPGTFRAWK